MKKNLERAHVLLRNPLFCSMHGPYLPCIQPNWCNRTLELFEWPDLRETKVMDEACKWLQANPTVWENWLPDATKCFPQFGLYNRASAPWALKLERKVISFRLQFLSTKTSAKPPVWWEVQKYTWHKSKRVWNHWIFGVWTAINDSWYSQPFYFLWSVVQKQVMVWIRRFEFGWTSPIAPQNDPRLGQTKGDNSPRNLKHPAYFVTEFERGA